MRPSTTRPASRRTVSATLVPDYLTWMRHKGYSAETIACRRRFFYRLQRALGIPADAATPEILAAWRAGLTVTDRAVERYVSHLRAYYAWCVEEGYRDDNPAARIPVPRRGRALPRPVSAVALRIALDAAPPEIRLMLVLAAWCGLRAKEIALLKRECILDTAARPVLIVAHDATKGSAERTVPLSSFVLAELARGPLPSWGYVFRRADGQPGPNRPARISQLCGNHFRDCDVCASLHMLRHWFGTGTYASSGDLRLVQELMGHASPVTTAGYAAFNPAAALPAVEALPLPDQLAA